MSVVEKPFDDVDMKRKVSQAIHESSFLRADHLAVKYIVIYYISPMILIHNGSILTIYIFFCF